jgi:uncharacterized protein
MGLGNLVWFVPLGFAVGVIGTLLGAGGGFLLVPVLLLIYPHESPVVIASISLAVVFFNAASGSVAYARMKRINYRAGLIFAAAAVPGAWLGSWSTRFVPRPLFDGICGALMLAAGFHLFFSPGDSRPRAAGNAPAGAEGSAVPAYNTALGAVISVVVGYVSSILGIGGGFIHVPSLVRFLNFPVHTATATSHFILAIMALTGTIAHLVYGSFGSHGLRRTVLLSIGVIVGAQVGAGLSNRVSGSGIVRGLAVVLVLVGLTVFRHAFRQ